MKKRGGAIPPERPPAVLAANVDELLREAEKQHRKGRLDAAIGTYRQALGQNPRHPTVLRRLGQALGQIGRPDQGIALVRRAVAADDDAAEARVTLAELLSQAGRPDEALASAEQALAADPGHVGARRAIAGCLERLNRLDEAVAMARSVRDAAPDDAGGAILLATLLRREGALTEARDLLETTLARDDVASPLRQRAWHALGTVLDRIGAAGEAFEAFARSGAEMALLPAARRLDRRQWMRRMDRYRDVITTELLARWRADSLPGPGDDLGLGPGRAPAFLVGFPRSGTTLLEQVLAAHPDIVTTNEAPLIGVVTGAIADICGSKEDVPSALPDLTRDDVRSLRARYHEAAAACVGGPPNRRVLVDKLPLNIIEIGLINLVFPEARVIVALRDPRDVCLSCFTQEFRLNAAMINFVTLEHTAEFYAAVMDWWLFVRERLTVDVIEMRYEDTVNDLEAQARRVLAFLGVPWRADVLAFHEHAAGRVISTPSFEAVAEPIHRRAVGRWRRYEPQMKPVLARLQPFVDAFGYGDV